MGGAPSADRPLYRRNPLFKITVEKESEDEPLGVTFECDWTSKGVIVHHVREDSCVARWNLLNPQKKLVKGDIVMAVNGGWIRWQESWEDVRRLFRKKRLRLTIKTGDCHEYYAKKDSLKPPRKHCVLPRHLPSDLDKCGCRSTECAICLDELEKKNKERPLVVLPCGHAFHKDCALSWLGHSDTWPAHCPVCRSEMPGERYEVIKGV